MTPATQPRLFPATLPRPVPDFDGLTYDRERDHARLSGCLGRVYDLMRDGRWRTLEEIRLAVPNPDAGRFPTTPGVSARLRDLRKEKFGGHCVLRRRRGKPKVGLWEYRMVREERKATNE